MFLRTTTVLSLALLGLVVYSGGHFLTLFFVGVPAALALVVLWFFMIPHIERSTAPHARRALWIGPLAFFVAVGGCVAHGRLTAPRIDALTSEGAGLVQRLEATRAREGEYPVELHDDWPAPVGERYGGWRYRATGEGFSLEVGDYARHEFELWYESERGWYLDT